MPGTTTTAVRSTCWRMATSFWPAPTVSMISVSKPAAPIRPMMSGRLR